MQRRQILALARLATDLSLRAVALGALPGSVFYPSLKPARAADAWECLYLALRAGVLGGGGPPPPHGDVYWYADVPASLTTGSVHDDGTVLTAWGTADTATGTMLLVEDSVVPGTKAVRAAVGSYLATAAGAADFLVTGGYTIAFVFRYLNNATNTNPLLVDSSEGGTQLGAQIRIGDTIGSIFFGRSMFVRQWDGAAWFDSSSTVIAPGVYLPGKWHVAVVRCSSTQLDIYIDGQFMVTAGSPITKPYLGSGGGTFRIGDGDIDFKAIEGYHSLQTEGEILATSARLAARFTATPINLLAGDYSLLGGAAASATFPFISKLPDGRLYATVYRGIDGPTATDHNDAYVSSDDGATWTFLRIETQNTNNLRYSDLKTSEPFSDGSIIQITFTYDSSNKTQHYPIWRRSTDSAATWSAWADANTGVTPDEAFVSQAPIEDPTQLGHLHMAVQTVETLGDPFFKIWDYFTSNAGTTWARTLVADGMADSKKYAEPAMRTTATGEFRMLIRNATNNGVDPMLQCFSAAGNHGVTWGAPAATNLPAFSSGQQARILASGHEVWIGRETGSSNKAAIFWRGPNAAANDLWEASHFEIDPLWGGMYYAGIYETSPGKLCMIYSRTSSLSAFNNNVATRIIDEWVLYIQMPGAVTPSAANLTALGTLQLFVTGAGAFTWAVSTNNTGGSVSPTGLYTAGSANGVDTITATDRNGYAVATCIVTVTGGTSGPTVSSISPNAGIAGMSVRILGTGFTGATGATVGGVALTSFVVVDGNTITGVLGAHAAAGGLDVVVTNVTTGTLTGVFTYLPASLIMYRRGDAVSFAPFTGWPDLTSNGNDAITGTFEPTATTLNGNPAVAFAPSETMTFAGLSPALTALDYFVLAQNDDDGATSAAVSVYSDDNAQSQLTPFSNRALFPSTGSDARYASGFTPAAGAWSSPWLLEIAADAAYDVWFNGSASPVFNSPTNTFGYTAVQRLGGGSGFSYSGKIAQEMLFSARLSGPDRTVVTNYLKTYGGIA